MKLERKAVVFTGAGAGIGEAFPGPAGPTLESPANAAYPHEAFVNFRVEGTGEVGTGVAELSA